MTAVQINLHSGQVPKNTEEIRRKGMSVAERKAGPDRTPDPPAALPVARLDSPAAASGLLELLKGDLASGAVASDTLFARADGLRIAALLDPGPSAG